MKIIPVIDLKDGAVVHAKEGNRDQYRPINTPLCQSSDIKQVIRAFLNLYDFDTFYIADLNALGHQGSHDQLIGVMTHQYPNKIFWVDRGCRPTHLTEKQSENHRPVLGSESFRADTIQSIKNFRQDFVLSLDYSRAGKLGAESLFNGPDYWPDTIIIMTLARVGSGSGPDIPLLKEFRQNYPYKNFIAAGGIRNKQDLIDLKKIGIEQALVASALHSCAIDSDDIAELAEY